MILTQQKFAFGTPRFHYIWYSNVLCDIQSDKLKHHSTMQTWRAFITNRNISQKANNTSIRKGQWVVNLHELFVIHALNWPVISTKVPKSQKRRQLFQQRLTVWKNCVLKHFQFSPNFYLHIYFCDQRQTGNAISNWNERH